MSVYTRLDFAEVSDISRNMKIFPLKIKVSITQIGPSDQEVRQFINEGGKEPFKITTTEFVYSLLKHTHNTVKFTRNHESC